MITVPPSRTGLKTDRPRLHGPIHIDDDPVVIGHSDLPHKLRGVVVVKPFQVIRNILACALSALSIEVRDRDGPGFPVKRLDRQDILFFHEKTLTGPARTRF